MAIHSFQCSGIFPPTKQIVPQNRHIKTIHKLGIQGREGALIDLNHKTFEIGKSNILYYEDAEIDSIKVNKYNGRDLNPQQSLSEFLIIDFTYSDYED